MQTQIERKTVQLPAEAGWYAVKNDFGEEKVFRIIEVIQVNDQNAYINKELWDEGELLITGVFPRPLRDYFCDDYGRFWEGLQFVKLDLPSMFEGKKL